MVTQRLEMMGNKTLNVKRMEFLLYTGMKGFYFSICHNWFYDDLKEREAKTFIHTEGIYMTF